MHPLLFHAGGAVLAALLLAYLHAPARIPARALAIALIVAALVYVGFAIVADASIDALLLEAAGVVVYGALAWLGSARSPWWLAIGWALHPAWDVGLHLYGPAAAIAPAWYAHACLTFDLAVAGYIAWRIGATRIDGV